MRNATMIAAGLMMLAGGAHAQVATGAPGVSGSGTTTGGAVGTTRSGTPGAVTSDPAITGSGGTGSAGTLPGTASGGYSPPPAAAGTVDSGRGSAAAGGRMTFPGDPSPVNRPVGTTTVSPNGRPYGAASGARTGVDSRGQVGTSGTMNSGSAGGTTPPR